LVFFAGDVGHIHIVGGRAKFFQLLASEDVNRNKMDLSMAVLSSLRSGHVDDFTGAIFDDHKTVLPQCRALHGVSSGRTRIGGVEGVLMLCREAGMLDGGWVVNVSFQGLPAEKKTEHFVSQGGAGAGRRYEALTCASSAMVSQISRMRLMGNGM
jgi:hypothetical protein